MGAYVTRLLGTGQTQLEDARARAVALRDAGHPGVLVPVGVELGDDGVVLARLPVIAGVSLAEATRTRRLSLGEVVTVAVGAADALAALHRVRLAHGDLSAANVMVHGRTVVLVDTMGARSSAGVGPAAGPGPGRADAADDVYALGSLLREIADAAAAPVVDAWSAPMVRDDAAARPPARDVAIAWAACAAPLPVQAPTAPVAEAMRAGALPRTMRLASGRGWRLERLAVRCAPLVALVAVAVPVALSLIPEARAAALSRAPQQAPAAIPLAADAGLSAADAAVRLTERRADALASADGRALLAVTLPGSPAALADGAEAAALVAGDLSVHGLVAPDVRAALVASTPGGATVAVTTESEEYVMWSDGVATRVPAATTRAVLDLRLTQAGWRVERVRPSP